MSTLVTVDIAGSQLSRCAGRSSRRWLWLWMWSSPTSPLGQQAAQQQQQRQQQQQQQQQHAGTTHSVGMEPAWTCRTPEEASQEGRSHVHTSTAPTSANEQHCRRWIGTPNCATFAAHKAGRLQALVDQSSSRIGRQEDRMHQATVSEIAVSCLAPRASATNDIALARKTSHGAS